VRFVSVVGARPQFVKAAVLSRALRQRHDEFLLHTGQHYDDLMSDVFFRELDMRAPHVNLGVGSGSAGVQTARMLEGIEAVLEKQRPDAVIVYGDTNSTLAGALAAAKLGLPVAHVEAGFRSYNRSMPEEINRVLTDHISTWLFCATDGAAECLKREGIEAGVHNVGDLMYDSLFAVLPRAEAGAPGVLARHCLKAGAYYLATVHRPANADSPERLTRIIEALGALDAPVVLPLHPRTAASMRAFGIEPGANVSAIEPVGYLEMLALEKHARAIVTDSGGVQREAYFLSVPCVTLREDSEWPEIVGDWNVLVDANRDRIIDAARRPRPQTPPLPVFGDGQTAGKIVGILERDPPNR
jgi:UDP-N-acetylglucosamine 2-epimerase